MSRIFISYSSKSKNLVSSLAEDVETANHQIWFDHKLTGGQSWWDQILDNIRQCDLVIFALTPEALSSYPCQLEYKYAYQLNKIILPVLVADGVSAHLLPSELSAIQFVDYRSQDKLAALRLMTALNSLPAPQPLPDPLPDPPAVPISYLGNLKEQVEAAHPLNFEDQTSIVFKLKEYLREGDNAEDVLNLLKQMKRRDDLFAKIEKEIDTVINSVASAQASGINVDKGSKVRSKVEEDLYSTQARGRSTERISIQPTRRSTLGIISAVLWGIIFWSITHSYSPDTGAIDRGGGIVLVIIANFIQIIAFRQLLGHEILSLKWRKILAVVVVWGISLSLTLLIQSLSSLLFIGDALTQWALVGVIFGFLGALLTYEVLTRSHLSISLPL